MPGFLVNRMLGPFINEAVFALMESTGTAADIDTGAKLGLNHPMGPLELSDFIGNDVMLNVMDVLYRGFGDPKFRAAPLLRQMVTAGHLGRKSWPRLLRLRRAGREDRLMAVETAPARDPFALSEEERTVRDTVRDWAQKEVAPGAAAARRGGALRPPPLRAGRRAGPDRPPVSRGVRRCRHGHLRLGAGGGGDRRRRHGHGRQPQRPHPEPALHLRQRDR